MAGAGALSIVEEVSQGANGVLGAVSAAHDSVTRRLNVLSDNAKGTVEKVIGAVKPPPARTLKDQPNPAPSNMEPASSSSWGVWAVVLAVVALGAYLWTQQPASKKGG